MDANAAMFGSPFDIRISNNLRTSGCAICQTGHITGFSRLP